MSTTGQDRIDRQLADDTIRFLMENTDLSPRQAEALVIEHGVDRKTLLDLAASMKAES